MTKSDAIPKGRRKHCALEDDTQKHLLEWIPKTAQNHAPMNRTEGFHYCCEIVGGIISEDWLILS
jgi:hypothetical protein